MSREETVAIVHGAVFLAIGLIIGFFAGESYGFDKAMELHKKWDCEEFSNSPIQKVPVKCYKYLDIKEAQS